MSETWQPPSLVCGECWGQNGTGQTGNRSYELKDENETPKCVLAFPRRFYVFPSAGRQRSNFRALSSDDPCGRTFLCTHCGTTAVSTAFTAAFVQHPHPYLPCLWRIRGYR